MMFLSFHTATEADAVCEKVSRKAGSCIAAPKSPSEPKPSTWQDFAGGHNEGATHLSRNSPQNALRNSHTHLLLATPQRNTPPSSGMIPQCVFPLAAISPFRSPRDLQPLVSCPELPSSQVAMIINNAVASAGRAQAATVTIQVLPGWRLFSVFLEIGLRQISRLRTQRLSHTQAYSRYQAYGR